MISGFGLEFLIIISIGCIQNWVQRCQTQTWNSNSV